MKEWEKISEEEILAFVDSMLKCIEAVITTEEGDTQL